MNNLGNIVGMSGSTKDTLEVIVITQREPLNMVGHFPPAVFNGTGAKVKQVDIGFAMD